VFEIRQTKIKDSGIHSAILKRLSSWVGCQPGLGVNQYPNSDFLVELEKLGKI
jgi:hypothetical protein